MVNSVERIIDALGGTGAVASRARVVPSAVSNWRRDGKIPSRHWPLFCRELRKLGEGEPPIRLFGFEEAD